VIGLLRQKGAQVSHHDPYIRISSMKIGISTSVPDALQAANRRTAW
jgi:hypothetical protein